MSLIQILQSIVYNLFNPATVKLYYYIDTNGNEANSFDWNIGDYISVTAGKTMEFSGIDAANIGISPRTQFYDVNKVALSNTTLLKLLQSNITPQTAVVPTGAFFMRNSVHNVNKPNFKVREM